MIVIIDNYSEVKKCLTNSFVVFLLLSVFSLTLLSGWLELRILSLNETFSEGAFQHCLRLRNVNHLSRQSSNKTAIHF